MQSAYIRPSLPLSERLRRDCLHQIAIAWNGPSHSVDKKNRSLVWLNLCTEKFELRQVKDGEWVCTETLKGLSAEEIKVAEMVVKRRRDDFIKRRDAAKTSVVLAGESSAPLNAEDK